MPRTLSTNQQVKADRPYVQPIYLVKINPHSIPDIPDPLYFSDRNVTYNSINYEAYFKNLDTLGESIKNLGGYNNIQFTMEFLNTPYRGWNYLIDYFDFFMMEKCYIEIWKLFIDTGETFGSDVSTKIFKGELGNPYDITELSFKVDIQSMLFGQNAKLPLEKIDPIDFPDCDPDDVGKYRNIIYGNLEKVPCPWTIAGWLSTLTADITAASNPIVVSDSTVCPSVPFTALCENEQIRVTTNNVLTGSLGVSRGYGGTTAVAHSKGARIYHQRTDFEAEVAQHPVKSIGNIYILKDGEWVRVISGATKYINTGGRAYIRFSDKVKFEEKTIESVSTGSHVHSLSGMPTNAVKRCTPSGPAGNACIDGNDSTGQAAGNQADFTEADLGTIIRQFYWVRMSVASGYLYVDGVLVSYVPAASGWVRVPRVGGKWSDTMTVGGGGAPIPMVMEMYKEVEYTPYAASVNTGPASGVALTGNSLANMKIGDICACDVEGYQDDVSGTYTGTPNALIERPDHVRNHILIALLGFALVDIDIATSWAATAAEYVSRAYKFAFVMDKVATETMNLFAAMDQQSRSLMFEGSGVFKLSFMSTSDPVSQKTFDNNNIKGFFTFAKSEVADIRNKIVAHYNRDYTKIGSAGDEYKKVIELTNTDSINVYGTMNEELTFSCIGDLAAMADDVLDWILLESCGLKKKVTFNAFWDASIIESCDYFTVNSNFWSGHKFKATKLIERMSDQTIEIEGTEFWSEWPPAVIPVHNFTDYRVPASDHACTWSRSAGVNNYALVDEVPPGPAGADYVYTSTDLADDLYGLSAPFAVPAGSIIHQVQITIGVIATYPSVGGVLHINGVSYEIGPMLTTPIGIVATNINPATGSAWTVNEVNGIGTYGLTVFGIRAHGTAQSRVNYTNISVVYTEPS